MSYTLKEKIKFFIIERLHRFNCHCWASGVSWVFGSSAFPEQFSGRACQRDSETGHYVCYCGKFRNGAPRKATADDHREPQED